MLTPDAGSTWIRSGPSAKTRTLTELCKDRPPINIADNHAPRADALRTRRTGPVAALAVTRVCCGSSSRVGISPASRVPPETAQGGLAPLSRQARRDRVAMFVL